MSIAQQLYDYAKKFCDKGDGYNNAEKRAIDDWIKQKRFKELLLYFIGESNNYVEEAEPFLKSLLQNQENKLFKIYWKHILSNKVWRIWEHINYWKREKKIIFDTNMLLSYDKNILNANKEKYPVMRDIWLDFVSLWGDTLDFIEQYIYEMQKINALEEIEKAKIIKQSIYELKKTQPKKTTDKRKMSEELFWKLINESRNASDSESDFLDVLKDKLEAFSPPEIKNFKKHFLEKINELYRWDIWALAYIVRRGCGDDGFDYYRAWVISRGKESFESVKNMQMEKLQSLFAQEEPQLEEMYYVANEAYENKKNEEMPEPRTKSQKIAGKEWEEKTICNDYPELCKMFGF